MAAAAVIGITASAAANNQHHGDIESGIKRWRRDNSAAMA